MLLIFEGQANFCADRKVPEHGDFFRQSDGRGREGLDSGIPGVCTQKKCAVVPIGCTLISPSCPLLITFSFFHLGAPLLVHFSILQLGLDLHPTWTSLASSRSKAIRPRNVTDDPDAEDVIVMDSLEATAKQLRDAKTNKKMAKATRVPLQNSIQATTNRRDKRHDGMVALDNQEQAKENVQARLEGTVL